MEAEFEAEGYHLYKHILDRVSRRLLEALDVPVAPDVASPLPTSVGEWRPFPEVPAALAELRAGGRKLAILSNVDRDLLELSIAQLGIRPDLAVTGQDAGSYKPVSGHWRVFLQKSGARADSTVHVGASQYHDMRPAAALGGDDVARLAPITVTFAKPPSDRAPEPLLQLYPETKGAYAWLSPRTLLFQPDFPGLLRGSMYTVHVPARPEAGVPQPVTRKFTVTGKLTVQQVIPGDGDTEVPLGAQVFVQFSRSVAPLTTLAAQRADPVLVFEPPLHGKGEWLNTAIYRFIPADLVPTTTYRVTVARGLTSAADGVLESDFHSTFTTIAPAVDSITPDGGWLYGGPWQETVVVFNQPMDPSAADGLSVRDAQTGAPVRGKLTWNAD